MSWTTICKLALGRTFVGSTLRRVPLVERTYQRYTVRRTDHGGLFCGKYDSYAAAQKDIPASSNNGWDNEPSGKIWVNHVDYMQPTAYAPFFWLTSLLQPGTTLIDYGGSIGVSYYSYTRRARMPRDARWIVVEVPHLAASGKRVAEREKAAQLEFLSDLASAPASDILLSAGALQFIEDGVPGFLEKLSVLPRHLLLNKVPVIEGPSYWTLHNFYTGLTPARVWNEKEFLRYFEDRGYKKRDSWKVPDLSLDVPFYPQCAVSEFSGYYLERSIEP